MQRSPFLNRVGIYLSVVCLALFACGIAVAQSEVATPSSSVPLFKRIVVLGASVSAGFDVSQPLGGPKALPYRFSNFLNAALTMEHDAIETHASALLFLGPQQTLERQIAATLKREPSLVVAIDSLFWFCYGAKLSPEQRLERFEAGLKLIESIPGPLLLGDIPDAHGAIGGILSADEVPDQDILEKCNRRLADWASARPQVTIFPLAKLMAAASVNKALKLGAMSWEDGKSRALLRTDGLHPSRHGLAALAIAVLESAAATAGLASSAGAICQDPNAVYEQGGKLGDQDAAKATPSAN